MKKFITRHIHIIAAAAVIVGCSTAHRYQQPDVQLPATYANTNSVDSSSIADVDWKSFFRDTALQQLISQTLSGNNDWKIALSNLQRSEQLLLQARKGSIPEVSVGINAQSSRPSDNSLNGLSINSFLHQQHIEDYTTSVQIAWEADIWGKIRAKKKQALASYMATFEGTRALQTSLVASVANDYYNLLMLDEQLRIARQNLLLGDSTVAMVKLQYTAGDASSLAIRQAEAQRSVPALLVPQLQQAISLQENALQILAGQLPGSIQRGTSEDAPYLLQQLNTGFPAKLLSQRPDVKARELELKAATAGQSAAKAALYPSLRISAEGGVNAFKASNWFNLPASLFGLVAGSLTQPLLQHRELKTQATIAGIDREQAVYRFRQSVLAAVGEVSDALVKVKQSNAQQSIAADRVQTLQQATANASLLFKNGAANYLEVITAQSNALQSELELASIKRDRVNAVIDLYRSLGGGWK